MPHTFVVDDFPAQCDQLAATDQDLQSILDNYSYPPFWSRANSFETLVHIILEQQVSLASAKAALEQLRARVGVIEPATLLSLTDQELKAAYFSRQKMSYARHLALAIQNDALDLSALEALPDSEVRRQLVSLKGIGNWTVDIYLIMVLHRSDVFPLGDLAAVNALRNLKHLPRDSSIESLTRIVDDWRPNRTIGTMLLWHYYLSLRGIAH